MAGLGSTARIAAALATGAILLAGAGCTGENPDYCRSDADCRGSRGGPYCHPRGHLCYAGCAADADCTDPTRAGYEPDRPRCDRQANHCVPASAGPDARVPGPLGAPCKAPTDCASGTCSGGVCCDRPCGGTCRSCTLAGSRGRCTFAPAGSDPGGDCPGDPACGGGRCDGKGACAYLPATAACKRACDGPATGPQALLTSFCDGRGRCLTATPRRTDCGAYRCSGSGLAAACGTRCDTHAGCVAASLCDRSLLHQGKGGRCVDPAKIAATVPPPPATPTLADAVKLASATRPYVRLRPGRHVKGVSVRGGTLFLAGLGGKAGGAGVVIDPATDGEPALDAAGGAKVVVQGVTLAGASGSRRGHGLLCDGASVTLLDASLSGNALSGASASRCTVVVRRSLVLRNGGGGLELFKGRLTAVNSVIAANGRPRASSVGLQVINLDAPPTLVNLTIADNIGPAATPAGLLCVGGACTVANSVLWLNGAGGPAQCSGCTYRASSSSDAKPPAGARRLAPAFVAPASGDYRIGAASACVDAGDAAAPGISRVDLTGGPRVKPAAGKPDLGAYEIR